MFDSERIKLLDTQNDGKYECLCHVTVLRERSNLPKGRKSAQRNASSKVSAGGWEPLPRPERDVAVRDAVLEHTLLVSAPCKPRLAGSSSCEREAAARETNQTIP